METHPRVERAFSTLLAEHHRLREWGVGSGEWMGRSPVTSAVAWLRSFPEPPTPNPQPAGSETASTGPPPTGVDPSAPVRARACLLKPN